MTIAARAARAVAVLCTVAASVLHAQAYPVKPIKLIVPNAPGGPVDSVARVLTQALSGPLGQTIVVENRIGAGGNIGTDAVAKAEPDGYTLLLTPSAPIVVNQSLFAKLPYDPVNDLAPVVGVYSTPIVITVPGSLPVNSLGELVAYIRERPGKLNFSSGGHGTQPHLAAEMFKQSAGLDIIHVAYRGGPEMTAAVVSGDVVFNFNGLIAMPLVRSGKLKVLGLAAQKRTQLAPEIPTFAEAGIAGVDANSWGAFFFPARTSSEVIARLRTEVVKSLADPAIRAKFASIGVEPVGNTTEELSAQIRAELAYWARLIKSAGIRVQ